MKFNKKSYSSGGPRGRKSSKSKGVSFEQAGGGHSRPKAFAPRQEQTPHAPYARPAKPQPPHAAEQPAPTEGGEQEPMVRPEALAASPALPPGTPVAHLKSASYGSFIYERMVGDVEGNPRDGDFVAVMDKRGRFFGWGFYNSRSMLRLRMFSHDPAPPNDAMIARRIAQAVALRRDVLQLERTTEAYRLVHSEGDGLSGLVADRFGPYVVIELFSLAMQRRLEMIEDAFIDAGLSVRNFVVRADKHICEQEGFQLGRMSENKERSVTVAENGVQFQIELSRGHKTGFFCDQRENRLALTHLTSGRSVLDVCCYTGGFSCYAGKLGAATSITAVDLDENALQTAGRNAALNQVKVEFHHDDAFDFFRGAGGRKWDVVVVDPSKFVPRRDAMEIGLKKYADLNRLAAGVVAPGGILLTCSCSGLVDQPTFVQTLSRAMRAAGRTMQIFRITGAGADHPFLAHAPEAAYLKAVWARLE